MNNNVIELFEQGKILARAMGVPSIYRNYEIGGFSYDFSVWADEYEEAKREGLGSLSTTLLVPEEAIPTYKAIGFLVNSDEADVRHIAETDSGSCGNEKNGDFRANSSDIKSLAELQEIIKSKHRKEMNEVNINMRENAYIGLFANKANSERLISRMLLAQKYYELQTGVTLPMYIYDSKIGSLESFDIALEEKASIIQDCLDNKVLRSSSIFYETQTGDTKCADYLEEIKKDIDKRDSVLKSAIEATEENTRTSVVNEQVGNIKQLTKGKDEKFKGTEIG